MLLTLEPKPRVKDCPRCESTDTFLTIFNNSRYCVSCHRLYNRTDEARLRVQKMNEAQWVQ